jgi:hypothetical protein
MMRAPEKGKPLLSDGAPGLVSGTFRVYAVAPRMTGAGLGGCWLGRRSLAVVNRSFDLDRPAGAVHRYIVDCQPLFERLRESATQLGGLSLMLFLWSEAAFDFETPLSMAATNVTEASEALAALPLPDAARHHFHHVTEAAEALVRVAALLGIGPILRQDEKSRREISWSLRAATDHLRFAACAMPGFETVDLRHSCCAVHQRAPLENTTEL